MPTYQQCRCACGCGKRFTPKSSHHQYIELSHASRAKRQRTKLGLRGKPLGSEGIAAHPPKTDAEEEAITKEIYARAEALRLQRTYNYHPVGMGRVAADVTVVRLEPRRGRIG